APTADTAQEVVDLMLALRSNRAQAEAAAEQVDRVAATHIRKTLATVGCANGDAFIERLSDVAVAIDSLKSRIYSSRESWLGAGRWLQRGRIDEATAELTNATQEYERLMAANATTKAIREHAKQLRQSLRELGSGTSLKQLDAKLGTALIAMGTQLLEHFEHRLGRAIVESLAHQQREPLGYPLGDGRDHRVDDV